MKLGTEDKKKVAILAAMLAIIVPATVWELHGYFAAPSAPRPAAPAVTTQRTPARPAATPPAPSATSHPAATTQTTATTQTAATTQAALGPEAEKIDNGLIDPTLHLAKLAQSEDVEYAGTGRNIFSAESAPPIPPPIKNPRETGNVTVPTGPPPPPQPPPIDLKYFGYEQPKDKSWIRAFLVHGDDIFVAKTGEIVDHRYKVTSISPSGIEVTDLAYNNTQTLPLMQ
jgi:hypothetical protein